MPLPPFVQLGTVVQVTVIHCNCRWDPDHDDDDDNDYFDDNDDDSDDNDQQNHIFYFINFENCKNIMILSPIIMWLGNVAAQVLTNC